jgi:hypothetical protein
VGNTQDYKNVGGTFFDQLTVGPGIDRPAALKVDMRAQDTTNLGITV